MVPGAGIEPARGFPRGILSPLRLPISPPGQIGRYCCDIKSYTAASFAQKPPHPVPFVSTLESMRTGH